MEGWKLELSCQEVTGSGQVQFLRLFVPNLAKERTHVRGSWEKGADGVNWLYVALDKDVPLGFLKVGKYLISLTTISF